MKRRKQKEEEYELKYSEIPRDFQQRLDWMYDKFRMNDKLCEEVSRKRLAMMQALNYTNLFVVLYEEPEGTPRPRFRLVNRKNLANMAVQNSQFVHVYSIGGAEDNRFMQRLVTDQELFMLDHLLCTPCTVTFNAYFRTPKAFNRVDTYLAELGCIRPITKPDWDNIGKKYSDMYNSNVWLDDTLVISGTVNKYYSILPRVEISLYYMNMVFNRYQYLSIKDRVDCEVEYFQ